MSDPEEQISAPDFMAALPQKEREVLITLAELIITPHCAGEDGVGCVVVDNEGPERICRIYCMRCGHVYVEAAESLYDLVIWQYGSVH